MSKKEPGIVSDAINLKVTFWVCVAVLTPVLPWVGLVAADNWFPGSTWGWDGMRGFFGVVALAWIGITAPLWISYSFYAGAAVLEVRKLRAVERADTGESS